MKFEKGWIIHSCRHIVRLHHPAAAREENHNFYWTDDAENSLKFLTIGVGHKLNWLKFKCNNFLDMTRFKNTDTRINGTYLWWSFCFGVTPVETVDSLSFSLPEYKYSHWAPNNNTKNFYMLWAFWILFYAASFGKPFSITLYELKRSQSRYMPQLTDHRMNSIGHTKSYEPCCDLWQLSRGFILPTKEAVFGNFHISSKFGVFDDIVGLAWTSLHPCGNH